jgi:anti-sigma regulatory factor (Ser/Thr protein kinase)
MGDKALSSIPRAQEPAWRILEEFSLPSEPGNERVAMEHVATSVRGLNLSPARLEQLKTAVAEAVLNAIEHGNQGEAELPVLVRVLASAQALAVHVTDQGRGGAIPELQVPDLAAKLDGQQSPRGWGFFLISHMVDDMRVCSDENHHTIELLLYLQEQEGDPGPPLQHGARTR